MLSRVANSICWMARYMERSNGMLRMLRTNYIFSQEEVRDFNWRSVLNLYSSFEADKKEKIQLHSPAVLQHLVLDQHNVSSVCNNISRARENARAVQDHITKEVWQCLNDYFHLMRDASLATQLQTGDPVTTFDMLIRHGLLYHGTVDITMPRNEGFTYLNLGKFLERAILSVDMLALKLIELHTPSKQGDESGAWRYLLYSLSGYELYIKSYRGLLDRKAVITQIIQNVSFPHSILYCLTQISRYFERLKEESLPESFAEVEFIIGRAMYTVKYAGVELGNEESVLKHLSQIRFELFSISDGLNQHFFAHN